MMGAKSHSRFACKNPATLLAKAREAEAAKNVSCGVRLSPALFLFGEAASASVFVIMTVICSLLI